MAKVESSLKFGLRKGILLKVFILVAQTYINPNLQLLQLFFLFPLNKTLRSSLRITGTNINL
jgi:hypothetical protein